jgi:signal transduction histidine kinase
VPPSLHVEGDEEGNLELPAPIPAGATVHVFVSVKDSGPGLKPGDLTLLFQRFQQGKCKVRVMQFKAYDLECFI